MKRIVSSLLILTLLSACAVSVTFAKYATGSTGSDEARAAKWGLGIEVQTDLKLFAEAYDYDSEKPGSTPADKSDSNTVSSFAADGRSVIAPGTSNSVDVVIINAASAPEVMYDFDVDLMITDEGTSDAAVSALALLDENPAWHWYVKLPGQDEAQAFGTHAELETYVKYNLSKKAVAPNNLPPSCSLGPNVLKIGWAWEYDISGENDVLDTQLGDLMAQGGLDGIKCQLTVRAEQVQEENDDQCVVAFDTNGGSMNPASQVITKGECAAQPDAPTKEGYDFTGWYKDAACEELFDFGEEITTSTILYAGWEKQPILKFGIDYTVNNDRESAADIQKGDTVTFVASSLYANYTNEPLNFAVLNVDDGVFTLFAKEIYGPVGGVSYSPCEKVHIDITNKDYIKYKDSNVDKTLNQTYYGLLKNNVKDAIVSKNISQKFYTWQHPVTSATPDWDNFDRIIRYQPNYYIGLWERVDIPIGERNVYVLSVNEICDYLGQRVDGEDNLPAMFVSPSCDNTSMWLRDVMDNDGQSDFVFSVGKNHLAISLTWSGYGSTLHPVFNIGL